MSDVELEWRLIYAMVVVGKSVRFANAAVGRLREMLPNSTPISYARLETYRSVKHGIEVLGDLLRCARTGKYETLTRGIVALSQIPELNLRTCSPADLERVPGIGPKTSRFFIAWTRPEARVAVLDRHVLRWMRENGHPDAPKGTPAGRRYAELERAFLAEADRRGKTPRELDLEIWDAAATAPNVVEGAGKLEGVAHYGRPRRSPPAERRRSPAHGRPTFR